MLGRRMLMPKKDVGAHSGDQKDHIREEDFYINAGEQDVYSHLRSISKFCLYRI